MLVNIKIKKGRKKKRGMLNKYMELNEDNLFNAEIEIQIQNKIEKA